MTVAFSRKTESIPTFLTRNLKSESRKVNKKMKWNRTMIVLTAIFVAFAVSMVIVRGSYWVYSQLMTTSLSDYTLSIEQTVNGLELTITGQLLDPDGLPVNAASILIYRCDFDGVVLETVATLTTDATGHYSHVWTAAAEGTYYWKSGYEVL